MVPGGGGVSKARKCVKLYWNFQRSGEGGGGGGLRENPFHGGGMDNFWKLVIILVAMDHSWNLNGYISQ